ncbi:MAG: BlaI/MecI/CopY family transcriptional regulator [Acidimicrobiales bacterium]
MIDNELRGVLGPLEADVMRVLWAADDAMSVRAVLASLNEGREQPLAYTTVMTVLARLADKGVLERTLEGRGFVYRPLMSDPAAIAVRNVVRDFGDSAIAHFVDQARADPKLLRRLTKLLEEPE